MPVRDIAIFLGAGASAADQAPLQREIISKYFASQGGFHSSSSDVVQGRLIRFFREVFSIDPSVGYPTFEEALGLIDLAVQRGECPPGLNDPAYVKWCLCLMIAQVLAQTIGDQVNTKHAELVSQLKRENLLDRCIFITTNYDLLIDNALAGLDRQKCGALSYGVDLKNFSTTREDQKWRPPSSAEIEIPLYKLHGSLNWLHCPMCNELYITPGEKGILRLVQARTYQERQVSCDYCQSQTEPVIVPPTFLKNFSNIFLAQVWHQTLLALRDVRQIIICGYSLPEADLHVKYLLKQTQLWKGRCNGLRICISNLHMESDDVKRLKGFLGREIECKNVKFEEFAKEPKKLIIT